MRYVIIGASAAGCKAAETLRRYAPDSPITVISEEAQPLYSRPLLTYVLSGEVAPEKVWLKGEDYFRQWNFEPRPGGAGGAGGPSRPRRAPPGRAPPPLRPSAHRLGGPAPPLGP